MVLVNAIEDVSTTAGKVELATVMKVLDSVRWVDIDTFTGSRRPALVVNEKLIVGNLGNISICIAEDKTPLTWRLLLDNRLVELGG